MIYEEMYHRERFEEEKRYYERQLDSTSNVPLDSLLRLYSCPIIKQPYCSTERYVHGIDLLNAIACYNSFVTLHITCAGFPGNGTAPLVILLNEGVDVNLCNEAGVTAFEHFAKLERPKNRINELVKHLFKCVHKLVVAGLHVHPQNQRQYDIVRSRDDMRDFVEERLQINYNDELERMKDVQLTNRMTLRDVLRENIDLSPLLSQIKLTIQDELFDQTFPRLGSLIRLRYNQIAARQQWKPLVTDALCTLTRRKLPQNCIDIITKDLMNYDLANMLTVTFNMCLENFKIGRQERRRSKQYSIYWSPKKILPRI